MNVPFNMEIIIDSREKKIYHILKYFREINQPFIIQKLEFGDYSIKGYESKFAIERKNGRKMGGGFSELKGNLCSRAGRVRFINEFDKAINERAELILLIENATGVNDLLNCPNTISSLNYISNEVYFNIFTDFIKEQNVKRNKAGLKEIQIVYCDNNDTGRMIMELCEKWLNENCVYYL